MPNSKSKLTRKELDAIPDKYLAAIAELLMGSENDTIHDLLTPRIRPTVENIYPLFIVMYVILIIAGTLMNCGMIYHITRRKLYKDPTYAYLINIAISDIIKCLFVLPITLAVLLIQNWIYGKFMCYFLPMLQDIPIHVSMMTYLLIAGDRYRLISEPGRLRIPAFVCALGSWFFAVCIVLPHPIYTTYLDLEIYRKEHLRGVGLCVLNLTENIQQYIRGLFVLTYIAPLTITTYVYVKASGELQTQEGPLAIAMYEARNRDPHSRNASSVSTATTSIRDGKRESDTARTTGTIGISSNSRTYDLYDAEVDVYKEKRTQKYLISMVSVFAVLFCPLMVLKLAKLALVETYENMRSFDITFTLFVWLGFSSTVTTPMFYMSWQMSRLTKERLKGYFCFWNNNPPRENPEVTENDASRDAADTANVARAENVRTGSLPGSNGAIGSPRGSTRP